MTSSPTRENLREAGPKPPFPQESLEYPGLDSEMTPRPHYGAEMTREGIEQIPDGEWEHTFKTNVSCPQ